VVLRRAQPDARRHGIVQVRTVVLIALLALVRRFIILDAAHVEP
jgi:hypothetical protein